jgi:hypothetical protein
LELSGAVLGVRGRGNGGGKQARWMKGSISVSFIGWRRRGAAGRGGEWPAAMGIKASSYCDDFRKGNRGGSVT